jgi:aspartate/tyrosine/aromatic aminotransferase
VKHGDLTLPVAMASKCKYLIYTCWEKPLESGGTIAGSLLHELCPQSEEEAKQMVADLKRTSETFYEKFLALNTTRHYVYIENKSHWW